MIDDPGFWSARLHPDDKQRVFDDLAALFEHGSHEQEYRWQIADGSYRWFYDRNEVVADEQGTPQYVVGVWMDVTERKRAEQELHRRKALLRTLIHSMPDLISACGPDGALIRVNRAFCEQFGVAEADVLNRQPADVVPDAHGRELQERNREVMNTGVAQHWQETIASAANGERRFETVVVPYDAADEQGRGTIAVSRDITERERALKAEMERQKAELASRSKTRFLANMSHEIRTPLNSILGYSQLLVKRAKEDTLPDYVHQYIEHINLNGYNLSEIINNILELSKIEEGKVTISPEPVDLALLIQRVYNLSRLHATDKGIELTYHYDPALPRMARTDRTKLTQILSNLVSNAIKFTPSGKQIRIEAHRRGDRVLLAVADEGIGILADKQAAIFEAFEQADSSITRAYGGTGLGLAICKRLSKVLGGQIHLNSTEGMGSTFSVELPLEPVTDSAQVMEVVDGEIQFAADTRILVVEDNPMNQAVVREMFRELGIEVHIADNGQDGVRDAIALQPECIFMDLHMPGMDGLEATRQLRELPELADVPIIGLSADAFLEQKDIAYEAGMTDYLTKPILLTKLVRKLARYVRRVEEAPVKPSHVLDVDSLKQYARPLLGQLHEMFVKLVPASIARLKDHARERRAGELVEEAHALKNCGMSIFATHFATLCRELEQLGKQDNWTESSALIEQLEPAYQDVVRALDQLD